MGRTGKSYTGTFDTVFLDLLEVHKLFGYDNKTDMIESALIRYKNNHSKDITPKTLLDIFSTTMNDHLKSIEKQIILNAENLIYLDYIFNEIFYKDNFNELLKNNPDELIKVLESAESSTINQLVDLIKKDNL